jgi:hypothetical protein
MPEMGKVPLQTFQSRWKSEFCDALWNYIAKRAVVTVTVPNDSSARQLLAPEESIQQAFNMLIRLGQGVDDLKQHLSNMNIPKTTQYYSEKYLFSTWHLLMQQSKSDKLPALDTRILENEPSLRAVIKFGASKICMPVRDNKFFSARQVRYDLSIIYQALLLEKQQVTPEPNDIMPPLQK